MDDRLTDIGRGAYAAIDEMVAALNVDYDRLEELRAERADLESMVDDCNDDEKADARAELAQWDEENGDELLDLETDAGDCEDREDAERRIHKDALSIEVRTGWYSIGERPDSFEFNILLTTGGPAVRIRGELDDNREPCRAWLEVQDWGTPWIEYAPTDSDVLRAYARCFYFGD